MTRTCMAIVLTATLAACAPPAQPPAGPPPGAASGAAGEITRADSQVSIAGDDSFVLRRQLQRLPDRYVETLTLDDGAIFYFRFNAPRAGEDADGRVIIERLLATETYRELGLSQRPDAFKAARNRYGTFDYAVLEGSDVRCMIMSQFFGGAGGPGVAAPRNQEFRLTKCIDKDNARAAALEADVMEIIARVNFDGGAMNRARR
jgi:hypothetical protein